jgi:hypothetical protein
VKIAPSQRLNLAEPAAHAAPSENGTSWNAVLADFTPDEVLPYKPFRTSGIRLDNIAGFFGSGSVGGLTATVSDLMRNYSITGEMSVLGSFKYTEGYTFVTSSKGRTTWTLGAYNIIQTRLDELFPSDDVVRTFLHREYGALGAVQYPLTAFSYVDLTMRAAGVSRSEFSDPALAPEWNAMNPGNELLLSPVVRLGFDHIFYELFTGPLKGYGVLLEGETSYYPQRSDISERFRIDASYYLQTVKRMVLAFQGVAGASVGGTYRNPFFISSDDILRGYEFGDPRLLGNYVMAGKTELRFPIGSIFNFPPLRGFLGYDIGSIFSHRADIGRNIEQSATMGLSLNFPPISVNFMQSYRLDAAPGPVDKHIFHFTFRYLYL